MINWANILRRIYFYRGIFKKDGNESDLKDIFDHVDFLPFDDNGRYLKLDAGNLRSIYVDHNKLPFTLLI